MIGTVIKHLIIYKTKYVLYYLINILHIISAASFRRNRCEGKIVNDFPCISNPNWH